MAGHSNAVPAVCFWHRSFRCLHRPPIQSTWIPSMTSITSQTEQLRRNTEFFDQPFGNSLRYGA